MKPTGIGIIGCGVIAAYHARALMQCADARLVAVADLREDVARKMAAEFNVGKVCIDPHELLADDEIDGVILALPANVRTDLGLAAFRAGKHMLTEKPVAMNADEVCRLIAARGSLVGASCSSRCHFTETARRATGLVASGALGKLRHLRCRVVEPPGPPPQHPPPAWRMSRALNGGGILVNWGSYDLDFLLGITGWSLVPRRAIGVTYPAPQRFLSRLPPGSDAEAHAIGLVWFEDEVMLSYERAEFHPGKEEMAWEIIGEEGSLQLEMLPKDGPMLIHRHASVKGRVTETVLWSGPESWEDIHAGPARDFVAAIREHRQGFTSLEKALVIAKITDAIYASAACGEVVEIAVEKSEWAVPGAEPVIRPTALVH